MDPDKNGKHGRGKMLPILEIGKKNREIGILGKRANGHSLVCTKSNGAIFRKYENKI